MNPISNIWTQSHQQFVHHTVQSIKSFNYIILVYCNTFNTTKQYLVEHGCVRVWTTFIKDRNTIKHTSLINYEMWHFKFTNYSWSFHICHHPVSTKITNSPRLLLYFTWYLLKYCLFFTIFTKPPFGARPFRFAWKDA